MDMTLIFTGEKVEFGDEKTRRFFMDHVGELIPLTAHTGKNGRDAVRHKQFMAIIEKCCGSMDYDIRNWKDLDQAKEDLLLKLKYACGFVRSVKDLDGEERDIPRSISFDSGESEADIEQFRVMAYAVLCQLMNCSRSELFGVQ